MGEEVCVCYVTCVGAVMGERRRVFLGFGGRFQHGDANTNESNLCDDTITLETVVKVRFVSLSFIYRWSLRSDENCNSNVGVAKQI